jgi:PIN domain nuclease of toxin-antitoxin system
MTSNGAVMPRTSKPTGRLLLDTHTWLWGVQGSRELSAAVGNTINQAAQNGLVLLSAISIWETALLAARGRLALGRPISEWVEQALTRSRVVIEPLSPEIAIESCFLPEDFRSDPADTIIVATARITGAKLMTRDRRILAYAARQHLSATSI